jgi:hypothetical protein
VTTTLSSFLKQRLENLSHSVYVDSCMHVDMVCVSEHMTYSLFDLDSSAFTACFLNFERGTSCHRHK